MADGSARSEKRLYATLDGMRGVAAIAVVILHAPALFGFLHAPSGGLAVDLFFVMSGFIIAHAYEDKLVRGALSSGRFILLRLIRLYPLYLVGLAFGVAEALAELGLGKAQAWTLPQMALSAVAGLFMLPAPPGILDGAAPAFRLNPPAWSLFFEMVANIVYALVAVRLSTRALVAFIAVSAIAILGAAWYAGDLNVGSYWNTLWGGFPRVAFSFSVGLLIYRHRERICVFKIHPLPILAVAAVLFAVDAGAWKGFYEVICTLLLLPALVVLGASVEPRGPLLPVCKFLGITSYAIYSLHYPLIMGIQGVARKLGWNGDGAPWTGLLVLAALLVGCIVLAKIYDEPLRRYLVGALGKRPPRTLRLQEQTK